MVPEDELEPAASGFGVVVGLILATVVVGGVIDLALDAPNRATPHVALEVVLILVSLGGIGYLARGWLDARRSLATAHRDLAAQQADRDAWRASAEKVLEGLGREVGRQFETWGLTGAERELALRLIKGHSVRRIAVETDRSERTVRQHAVSVYRKSGLSGRAELAGFFLGGLLVGSDSPPGRPASQPVDPPAR